MIAHNKPTIGRDEVRIVAEILNSKQLCNGRKTRDFENTLCKYVGKKYGIALNSATNALFMALVSLGIEKNDEIILPTYVCSSLLNPIYYLKAKPILVDVDEDTFNIDLKNVEKYISKKTKAIIIPHTYGSPVDIKCFIGLGIPIIEDCAQSLGAEINKRKVGFSGNYSIFSFYATKMITTGYGGMLLTNSRNQYDRIKDLTTYDMPSEFKIRHNFSFSDIQAGMGIIQLKRLAYFIKKRNDISRVYDNAIAGHRIKKQESIENSRRVYFRYVIKVKNADAWIKEFKSNKINIINPLERRELLHRYLGQNPKSFPNSEKIVTETVSLPIYPSLATVEINRITQCLKYCLNNNR